MTAAGTQLSCSTLHAVVSWRWPRYSKGIAGICRYWGTSRGKTSPRFWYAPPPKTHPALRAHLVAMSVGVQNGEQ